MPRYAVAEISQIPQDPGVYRFYNDKGALLYVGKAKSLSARIRSYFEGRTHGPHIDSMLPHISVIDITLTSTERDALLLEQRLIQTEKPRYNIIFRDGKTYSYLHVTSDPIPQLHLVHGARSDNGSYIGPFIESGSARHALDTIQGIFQLRTCDQSTFANRSRPCVLHQIQRCSAPCVGLISPADYRVQVQRALDHLHGRDKELLATLSRDMQHASDNLLFEKAASLRDQIRQLSSASPTSHIEPGAVADLDLFYLARQGSHGFIQWLMIRHGSIQSAIGRSFSAQASSEHALDAFLSQLYVTQETPPRLIGNISPSSEWLDTFGVSFSLPTHASEFSWSEQAQRNALASLTKNQAAPSDQIIRQHALSELLGMATNKIECFDISHFQGEGALAACVSYEAGSMIPSRYRHYTLAPEHAGDDFASMKEALIRRYQALEPSELPDLVIIDGGDGQLRKAQEALSLIGLKLRLLGMAKGAERITGNERLIPSWELPAFTLSLDSPALLLLASIRDEAHRFAIQSNRRKLLKNRAQSSLLSIPGVGPQKRKALLAALGSLDGISRASRDDLLRVPGIGEQLADAILQWFHRN